MSRVRVKGRGEWGREESSLQPSQCLSKPVLSEHLFKINLRNYHSAGVLSLGFYNFIFLLQCLYPRAPRFISAAQPQWIIKRGRERKGDERHKRSIIHTQSHTFGGDDGLLLSLFLGFYLFLRFNLNLKCFLLSRSHASAMRYRLSYTCTHIQLIICTHTCLLSVSSARPLVPEGISAE